MHNKTFLLKTSIIFTMVAFLVHISLCFAGEIINENPFKKDVASVIDESAKSLSKKIS